MGVERFAGGLSGSSSKRSDAKHVRPEPLIARIDPVGPTPNAAGERSGAGCDGGGGGGGEGDEFRPLRLPISEAVGPSEDEVSGGGGGEAPPSPLPTRVGSTKGREKRRQS